MRKEVLGPGHSSSSTISMTFLAFCESHGKQTVPNSAKRAFWSIATKLRLECPPTRHKRPNWHKWTGRSGGGTEWGRKGRGRGKGEGEGMDSLAEGGGKGFQLLIRTFFRFCCPHGMNENGGAQQQKELANRKREPKMGKAGGEGKKCRMVGMAIRRQEKGGR
ncbi:hypothetical protein niasHT_039833 [Heterodera trifolii]|uniref:Uncharacterized protein n=1 Tax=Heterodera trifolii TaxID=157864 RepID=A0ABD2IV36_9BILA